MRFMANARSVVSPVKYAKAKRTTGPSKGLFADGLFIYCFASHIKMDKKALPQRVKKTISILILLIELSRPVTCDQILDLLQACYKPHDYNPKKQTGKDLREFINWEKKIIREGTAC